MYPVSDRFLAALRKSHTIVSRVDLMRQGEVLISDIPVTEGTVTDDSQALIRRRAQLTMVPSPETLALIGEMPLANGGLWPLGNELKLHSGIEFSPGDIELVSLGVYRISRPQLNDDSNGVALQIEGFDRGRAVSRAGFPRSYHIAKGTNVGEAIKDLVQSRLSWLNDDEFLFMETTEVTPDLMWTGEDDPWQEAQNLAMSIGAEVLFNGDGACVLREVPDPAYTPPCFDYVKGEDATLVSITRDLDDEQAYNGIEMISENSALAKPLRSLVWDRDPTSPTYYDPGDPDASVYGPVPLRLTSQTITTQAQCDAAAKIELQQRLGIIDHIDFTAITNPAHEAGDIIRLYDSDIGANAEAVLDSINLGIADSFVMSGSTRQRRVT